MVKNFNGNFTTPLNTMKGPVRLKPQTTIISTKNLGKPGSYSSP